MALPKYICVFPKHMKKQPEGVSADSIAEAWEESQARFPELNGTIYARTDRPGEKPVEEHWESAGSHPLYNS